MVNRFVAPPCGLTIETRTHGTSVDYITDTSIVSYHTTEVFAERVSGDADAQYDSN